MLKTGNFTSTDVAVAGIFIGFVIFCLISINQIGVGIWGFIFMGYLQGWSGRQKNGHSNRKLDHDRSISKKFVPKPTLNVMPQMSTAIFGVLGLTLSLMPNITDVQMLSAAKSKNYDVMLEVVSKSSATQAHKDRYLNSMLEEGRETEAYEFALTVLQSNPRSDLALRVIGSHEGAPKNLRITSLEQLIKQDPNNLELSQNIRGLINSLGE
jgi:hypothetical protein